MHVVGRIAVGNEVNPQESACFVARMLIALAALAFGATSLALAPPLARAQNVTTVGRAPTPEDAAAAEQLFRQGEEHYRSGRFAEAASLFTEAYIRARHPWLLYHVYLAHRDAEQEKLARDALARYLEEERNIPGRARLQLLLDRLEAQYGSARKFPASGLPPLAEQPAVGDADPERVARVASLEKKVSTPGIVLVAAGAAVVGAGAIVGLVGRNELQVLKEQCPTRTDCPVELEASWKRGRTLSIVADVTMGAGLVAAIVGAVLLLAPTGRRDADVSEMPVAVCSPTGCSIAIALPF